MSEPLRVAFVVEGPTDFIMLKEVVGRILEGERRLHRSGSLRQGIQGCLGTVSRIVMEGCIKSKNIIFFLI